ncbi:MAG: hypothetical protein J6T84_05730 [Spirochaetaceae bacterium]|nr:hypothetical protein [Spirochaetaceae bacterium]
MKYSELIEFEPLISVIKIADDAKAEKRLQNVKTYVFSDTMINMLCTSVVPNLDTSGKVAEQKGISIVGSFGTGKSHLMSVISSIAEDESLLEYVSNDKIKQEFKCFAGKYKVLRFEVANTKPLWELVTYRIEKYLNSINVDFHFDSSSKDTYREQIQQMMSAFEEKYPDKYFLIVIDEMLEYLRSRDAIQVNGDLMTLRQLEEACDGSRFKFMYGVQEHIYRDPLLAHVSETLNKTDDRLSEVKIDKIDVEYVVKNRLLKKTPEQKQRIREHLLKFSHLFDGLNTNLNEFVELFPVHPSYISTFQQIKHGKDKREILKILSYRFDAIKNESVPTDNPGLITYDSYFNELRNDSSMLSIKDVASINDKVSIIEQNITSYFNSKPALKTKLDLAKRLTNALAIRALCDDLDKHLGASAFTLKEDLCITMLGIDDPELLKDTIEATAEGLVTATQGQYIIKDENSEDFSIRTEGGINVEQIVKDYAEQVIKRSPTLADKNFFNLLKFLLGIEFDPYRPGFDIWNHSIEWKSTRSFKLGYIFFGNPNERSTTEPIQQFYMYFCPLFSEMQPSTLEDEVYFDFSNFGEDFRNEVCLYAASIAKLQDSSSDLKKLFESQVDTHRDKVKNIFNKNFVDKMNVIYKGKSSPLKSYQLPPEGSSKLALFSDITSTLLDTTFNSRFVDYPQFKDLLAPITPDNIDKYVKSALTKIIKYNVPNREGQAILAGLGLAGSTSIDLQNSKYAASIKNKLKEKGPGKVLNREDVIYPYYLKGNQYYSVDYCLEYKLEFIVLAALVFDGAIEITWNGDFTLTAGNIETKLLSITDDYFYLFNTITTQSDLPYQQLKKLFSSLGLPDLTGSLKEPSTFSKLSESIMQYSDKVVKSIAILQEGIRCNGISLIDESDKLDKISKLNNLMSVLNTVRNFDTFGKLKGFKYSEQELEEAFSAYTICDKVSNLKAKADKFERLIRYMTQAKSYVVESEKPLYDNMENAINKLADKLKADEKEQKQYEALLNSLIDSYAEYYLSQYTKYRLNYSDAQKRDCLLNSDKKQICEVLKDITILNKTDFENWRNTITSLKPAEADVTREKIRENAYQDFNPRENYDKPSYSVNDLEDQLDAIYSKWEDAIKATFNDPGIDQNLNMLTGDQKTLATNFKNGSAKITTDNCNMMRDIINNLSNGFEKVELTNADFASIFSKPMGVEEAKQAFDNYIENQCAGKDRNKIRIILSGK